MGRTTIKNVSDLCDKLGTKRRRLEGIIPFTAEITTWDYKQDDLSIHKKNMHGSTYSYGGDRTVPYHTESLSVRYQGETVLETEKEIGFASDHFKKVNISPGEWEDIIETLLQD